MAKKPKEEATYTDIFAKTICELAQTHEKLVTITAAMMDGCGYYGGDAGRNRIKAFP